MSERPRTRRASYASSVASIAAASAPSRTDRQPRDPRDDSYGQDIRVRGIDRCPIRLPLALLYFYRDPSLPFLGYGPHPAATIDADRGGVWAMLPPYAPSHALVPLAKLVHVSSTAVHEDRS